MQILIVDDVEMNRNVLAAYLRKKNAAAKLEFAVNGSDAVSKFRTALEVNAPYDLIIMDYQMPVMNGDDAVRRIRELEMAMSANKRFCTICVSSAEQSYADVFSEWIDNDKYFCTLPKPIDLNKLESIYFSAVNSGCP